MSQFDRILGLEKPLYIVFIIFILCLGLAIVYLYIASVFVRKNEIKIVERFKKEPRVLKSGWHFIVPLRDKVVRTFSSLKMEYRSEKPLKIVVCDKNLVVNFNVTFIIINPLLVHNSFDNFFQSLETKIIFYVEKEVLELKIKQIEDIYKFNSLNFKDKYGKEFMEFGIQVENVMLLNISMQ